MSFESVKIRLARPDDDYESLTELIQSAYKVLLDKGMRYLGTYQDTQTTINRINSGEGYIAEIDNKVVGTITLKEVDKSNSSTPWYDKEDVCFFSQFAVTPKLQKSGLGSFMMDFVEARAREKGYSEIALDTSERAAELIKYYEKRGYRFIEYVQWDRDIVNYRSVILSKSL